MDPNQKKAGMDILILHKIDFRTRNIIRNIERYFSLIKELIHQEDIIKNKYAFDNRTKNYLKLKLIEHKREIDKSTTIINIKTFLSYQLKLM